MVVPWYARRVNLCERCGLCCDGTLFESVEIEGTALSALARHRLPIVTTTQGVKLPLPCVKLAGTRCSIYDERPARCRDYRCELLRGLDAGRVSEAAAEAVVAEARRLRDAVRAALPPGRSWWSAEAELRRRGGQPKSTTGERLVALARLLRTRFWQ
ncbi:MAG: YkgJ family cysteine cluster protein [Polyangiaceae bacterium]